MNDQFQITLPAMCLLPHAGGRNLLDVRARMQQNAEMQRHITREAEDVELDMMKEEMANKGKVRHVTSM